MLLLVKLYLPVISPPIPDTVIDMSEQEVVKSEDRPVTQVMSAVLKTNEMARDSVIFKTDYYYRLQIGDPNLYGVKEVTNQLKAAPILKDGVTYVPFEVIEIMNSESKLLNDFVVRY